MRIAEEESKTDRQKGTYVHTLINVTQKTIIFISPTPPPMSVT